jgi:hypothetical protein
MTTNVNHWIGDKGYTLCGITFFSPTSRHLFEKVLQIKILFWKSANIFSTVVLASRLHPYWHLMQSLNTCPRMIRTKI